MKRYKLKSDDSIDQGYVEKVEQDAFRAIDQFVEESEKVRQFIDGRIASLRPYKNSILFYPYFYADKLTIFLMMQKLKFYGWYMEKKKREYRTMVSIVSIHNHLKKNVPAYSYIEKEF